MKCPREECDGQLTAFYGSVKYVEYLIDSVDEDSSIHLGEIYDIDFDPNGEGPEIYCTSCAFYSYTIGDLVNNDS